MSIPSGFNQIVANKRILFGDTKPTCKELKSPITSPSATGLSDEKIADELESMYHWHITIWTFLINLPPAVSSASMKQQLDNKYSTI